MGKLVNIGCGRIFHEDWLNYDLSPPDPRVRQLDVRKGLPVPEGSCDGAYASHVLEHLDPAIAVGFMKDCHRVLKEDGVLRIVVPDLEGICREYIEALSRVRSGEPTAIKDHEWMCIEIFDQMTRAQSGGRMRKILQNGNPVNRNFIEKRVGANSFSDSNQCGPGKVLAKSQQGLGSRLQRRIKKVWVESVLRSAGYVLPSGWTMLLREARVRASGEVHRFMYDEISLKQVFEDNGFSQVCRFDASNSYIDDYSAYELDTVKGIPRKPDSLYMEGRKKSL